jgi:hypothetical protein
LALSGSAAPATSANVNRSSAVPSGPTPGSARVPRSLVNQAASPDPWEVG